MSDDFIEPSQINADLGYSNSHPLFNGYVNGYRSYDGTQLVSPENPYRTSSTLLHESYSHATDEKIPSRKHKFYDLSDYLNKPTTKDSHNWYEARATLNELGFKLWLDAGMPNLDNFRKIIDEIKPKGILKPMRSINGYGYDYVKGYKALTRDGRIEMITKIKDALKYLPSIGTPGMPYLYDPVKKVWNTSTLNKMLQEGRDEFQGWINSPEYKQAALENMKEAESMGLGYTPTYEKANFSSPHDVKVRDLKKPGLGGTTDLDRNIELNIRSTENPKDVYAHELGHASDHGNVSQELMKTNPEQGMKEWQYLKYKASQVFKPNSDYSIYDLSRHAPEAVMNARDVGKALGLKIGQEYPGYEKALQILKSYPKNGFKAGLIDMFKTDRESMPYVWKALTGVQFGTTALLYLNKQKKDKNGT